MSCTSWRQLAEVSSLQHPIQLIAGCSTIASLTGVPGGSDDVIDINLF
jgi:hypothetical protein